MSINAAFKQLYLSSVKLPSIWLGPCVELKHTSIRPRPKLKLITQQCKHKPKPILKKRYLIIVLWREKYVFVHVWLRTFQLISLVWPARVRVGLSNYWLESEWFLTHNSNALAPARLSAHSIIDRDPQDRYFKSIPGERSYFTPSGLRCVVGGATAENAIRLIWWQGLESHHPASSHSIKLYSEVLKPVPFLKIRPIHESQTVHFPLILPVEIRKWFNWNFWLGLIFSIWKCHVIR